MNTYIKFITAFFAAVMILVTVKTANAQTVSDAELKKNQAPITNSLSYIEQLKPLTFEFNKDKFKQLNLPGGTQYGFITEDVQRILPGLITKQYKWYVTGKNNQRAVATNAIDYDKLIPLLVGAIKEQQAEIAELRANIQQLKGK